MIWERIGASLFPVRVWKVKTVCNYKLLRLIKAPQSSSLIWSARRKRRRRRRRK
jgi:hypothetical protein